MRHNILKLLFLSLINYHQTFAALQCGAGFQPPVQYGPFDDASAAVSADLNRDGRPDLIVANTGSGTISVLLGNGNGTFQPPTNYPSGTYAGSLAIGDFNRDGNLDVAASNSGNNNVRVFYGNGTGGLAPGGLIPVGASPRVVRAGDFNRDGKLDLVTANSSSANVSISFGVGDGTFQAPVFYPVSSGPWSIHVSDINQDGYQDLLVPTLGVSGLSVLYGTPGGNFQPAITLTAGNSPSDVAVGDLNRDGRPDLIVSNSGGANVSVLLATSPSTYAPAANYLAGNGPSAVRLGDLNGDGLPDVVITNSGGGSGGFSVLYSNANGTLQPRVSFTAGSESRHPALDDFNNDGRLDIAVPNATSDNLSVLLGFTGNTNLGGFPTSGPTYSTGMNPYGIVSGDFNSDGKPDLITANVSNNTLSVLLASSSGTFLPAVTYPAPARPIKLVTADFNRDGKLDVAVASLSGHVSIHFGNGDGTLGNATLPYLPYSTPPGTRDIVAIDLNRDGSPDIAAINEDTNSFTTLTNDGFGFSFAVSSLSLPGRPQSLATGDFNRDGLADLAVGISGTPNLVILSALPMGGFSTATQHFATTVYRGLTTGDFNRDGILDLLVASSNGTNLAYGSVLFGNGNGTFQAPVDSSVSGTPFEIAMGDFNVDGNPDFLVTSNPSGLAYRRGLGAGAFMVDANYPISGDPTGLAIADFNGDGRPDIAIARASANNVMILTNLAPYRPNIVLTSSTANPLIGEAVTFTATVSAAGSPCAVPTGLVYFQVGATGLGEFPLNSSGVATVTTSALPLGANPVIAAYRGDTQFHQVISNQLQVTVLKLPATLTLSDLSQLYDGNPKQATVTTNPLGLGAITVTYDGSTTLPVNPGNFTVVATLNNPSYIAAPATGTLVIINPDSTAPLLSSITLTPNPAPLGTAVSLSTFISDIGRGGSVIASADYSTDSGATWLPLTGAFGSALELTATASLTLPVGVHSICVRAQDARQNTATECGTLLAVYNPAGGFVTGGGWINSPVGAFPASPTLSDKANFGFSSKYENGANVPTGDTQFRFHAAGMQFKSTSYEWLTVAGARAQFKGIGTINGTGDYAFLLTAIDSQINGGGNADRFRIKIWDRQSGIVIYDNQIGKDEYGSDATELGGGSIIIHKP